MAKKRIVSERMKAHLDRVHAAMVTHGMSRTPTHNIWHGMKQRCGNPNFRHFARYGGRGITIDPRWDSFAQFLQDMGEKPNGLTLERIDNDGPYSKENCKWATRAEQARNRACCRFYSVGDVSMTISQWSRASGIHRNTLDQRVSGGMSMEDAIAVPVLSREQVVRAIADRQLARTNCKWGHEWTPENTRIDAKGGRVCRTCRRTKAARQREAKKLAA